LAYYEIVAKLADGTATRYYDADREVPYLVTDAGEWIGYDDVQSFTAKLNFLKSKNLRGAMHWAIDLDDMTTYPMLNTIKEGLVGYRTQDLDTTASEPTVSGEETTILATTTVSPPGVSSFPTVSGGDSTPASEPTVSGEETTVLATTTVSPPTVSSSPTVSEGDSTVSAPTSAVSTTTEVVNAPTVSASAPSLNAWEPSDKEEDLFESSVVSLHTATLSTFLVVALLLL
jgi:hypothetical protein